MHMQRMQLLQHSLQGLESVHEPGHLAVNSADSLSEGFVMQEIHHEQALRKPEQQGNTKGSGKFEVSLFMNIFVFQNFSSVILLDLCSSLLFSEKSLKIWEIIQGFGAETLCKS